ncbi:VPLPA-CTERM sorting domain-containing protein [Methylomonas methanica]|uniref:Variant PEP-CTERM exosortase signal n=1 Tax=Methylomonas methanica (strain DSM 25384 / MC09) TaxID=857087 RepID=F9ZZG2_METMM|nr:VPLPA-CTERM sorting domain-containing protein [Methylomonas methanica]AEG02355.1 variant PEP-CTERM exosortase signal [Methylomonas methanica MC09]
MNLLKTTGFTLLAYALCTQSAFAIAETENNDDFTSRNILAPGILSVEGQLAPGVDLSSLQPNFSFQTALTPDQVISQTITGQVVSTPFFAAIDNSTSGVDTILGVFDQTNTLISLNDDGSPLGNGLASAIGGQVNNDGTIKLQVTGFPNETFSTEPGSHSESGAFDLNVYLGIGSLADLGYGDVDYFSFTGLTPDTAYKAEITSAEFDTTLGLFDANGNLILSDDDGGLGSLSSLTTMVDSTGTINLAVSGFGDFEFLFGSHIQSGQYQLTLTAVPLPASVWFLGSGLAALLGLSKRKRRQP